MRLRKIQNTTAFGLAVQIGVSHAVSNPAHIKCEIAIDNGSPALPRQPTGTRERHRTKPRSRSSMPLNTSSCISVDAVPADFI